MASGTELHLGFKATELERVADALNIKLLPKGERFPGEWVHSDDTSFSQIVSNLTQAYEKSLLDYGFIIQSSESPYGFYQVERDTEQRRMSSWSLNLHWNEEWDEKEEHGFISVNLSARYYPCFTDWKDPHGAAPIILDKETNRMIEIATENISAVLPVFKEADLIVVEKHY